MSSLSFHQILIIISFGSFEPIKLHILFPMSFTMFSSQALCITFIPQGNDLKPNSCEDQDNK